MTLVEFAEFLVTKIAKETEMVKAKEFETEEGLVLEILVSENDIGRVIGKQGKMANSLKTILALLRGGVKGKFVCYYINRVKFD